MAQVIEDLIEAEDERLYWTQAGAAYERLAAEPRQAEELQAEHEIEEGAVMDGVLDEDDH